MMPLVIEQYRSDPKNFLREICLSDEPHSGRPKITNNEDRGCGRKFQDNVPRTCRNVQMAILQNVLLSGSLMALTYFERLE
ncbi:unnamed protein product [Acanthoscelides obtectus]|uniref:Uncharacterized protein n=1 Tax=Acanthoscelides obtectus TaxID=200917 RepID=A0A9P0PJ00_ACAOB|nr:unnamed protein product [Acanthoscelides obtectus]CAK1677967.1 hypothetical protein AOBTE_LOCUS31684 [Acanthoscelides obtectus]